MAQIKFYSVSSMPTGSVDSNGIYFKASTSTTGELYKGTTRFGGGRVLEVADKSAAEALTDAVQGDIAMCSVGGAYAYDGSKWVSIGPDISELTSEWRSDITEWVSGLSVGDSASYITNITQDESGKVTAQAKAFPTLGTGDNDGEIKLGDSSAKVSGWDELVSETTDLESRVSAIETVVSVSAGGSLVSASTGTFDNLVVTDVASFTAVELSVGTLSVDSEDSATFGGSTISEIADREALSKIAEISAATGYSSATGVEVSVITQSGSVKEVQVAVNATASAADINPSTPANTLARAVDVANAMAGLTGAMHFRGVFASKEEVTDPKNGDIIIVKTTVEGVDVTKEYVYSKPTGASSGEWIELGDETQVSKLVTYTGLGTTLTTGDANLASAVNKLDAEIKAMDYSTASEEVHGVKVQVVQEDGAITSVITSVDAITSADGIVTGEGKVVTAGAVSDLIDDLSSSLTSTVTSSAYGIGVEVVQNNGKLTSASLSVTAPSEMTFGASGSATELATTAAVKSFFDNNLVWLDASGTPIS